MCTVFVRPGYKDFIDGFKSSLNNFTTCLPPPKRMAAVVLVSSLLLLSPSSETAEEESWRLGLGRRSLKGQSSSPTKRTQSQKRKTCVHFTAVFNLDGSYKRFLPILDTFLWYRLILHGIIRPWPKSSQRQRQQWSFLDLQALFAKPKKWEAQPAPFRPDANYGCGWGKRKGKKEIELEEEIEKRLVLPGFCCGQLLFRLWCVWFGLAQSFSFFRARGKFHNIEHFPRG